MLREIRGGAQSLDRQAPPRPTENREEPRGVGDCTTPSTTIDPQAVAVPVGRGRFALIDAADEPLIAAHRWYANNHGYACSRFGQKIVSMQRVIMGLSCGDGLMCDHVNHVRLDNRRRNLRVCLSWQNQQNSWRGGTGKSRYRGVHWEPERGKWRARIWVKGKRHVLGTFLDEIDAAKARDAAAREMVGEFAVLNFPDEVAS